MTNTIGLLPAAALLYNRILFQFEYVISSFYIYLLNLACGNLIGL